MKYEDENIALTSDATSTSLDIKGTKKVSITINGIKMELRRKRAKVSDAVIPPLPIGYVLLEKGEVIADGDYVFLPNVTAVWQMPTRIIGHKVGIMGWMACRKVTPKVESSKLKYKIPTPPEGYCLMLDGKIRDGDLVCLASSGIPRDWRTFSALPDSTGNRLRPSTPAGTFAPAKSAKVGNKSIR